jgi:hypothetical protein
MTTPFDGIKLRTPECSDSTHDLDSKSHPAVALVPMTNPGTYEPYAWPLKCADCLATWEETNPGRPYLALTPVLR